jgi:hypothetical protein
MGRSSGQKWDRRVLKAVRHLERQGCTVRVLDGHHMILRPPDCGGCTLKVSASRPAEDTLVFLRRQFAAPNGLSLP